MRPSVVIALALALAFGGASAQGPSPQRTQVDAVSMNAYGDTDKTCQEWTDSCRTCQRPDASEPTCSNIGIACQPGPITCARRAEPPK